MTEPTAQRLALIDEAQAQARRCYLRAVWAGHDGEAEWYEVEVDRLESLRTIINAGPLITRLTVDD